MGQTNNWTGERLETHIKGEVMLEHLHRYAFALDYVQGKKVVDIACGEGYGAHLLSATAAQVTGIDIDRTTIQKAISRYRKNNLHFMEGSATAIPLPDQVADVLISFETLEHVSEHPEFLQEIKRVLVPGGILIISTPDKKNYSDQTGYKNPFHVKELYENEFRNLLTSGFGHVQILAQQSFTGSLISGANGPGLELFTGDYTSIGRCYNSAMYRIGLASDSELPLAKAGAFCSNKSLHDIITTELALLKKTTTYRLGHLLLSPAKFIRGLFRK